MSEFWDIQASLSRTGQSFRIFRRVKPNGSDFGYGPSRPVETERVRIKVRIHDKKLHNFFVFQDIIRKRGPTLGAIKPQSSDPFAVETRCIFLKHSI